MATIKTNERELSAKVAQWFDEIIKSAAYPFKEASPEPGVTADDRTLFADTVIWYNRLTNQAASYVELKPPFGRKEDLERFKKKAANLNVKYAFTWNFQTLKCYEVKAGKVNLVHEDPVPILSKIEEWKRADKQANIKTIIGKICDELANLLETGKPLSFIPDKVFFVDLIRKTTNQLLDVFESFIHKSLYNKSFKGTLKQYAILQGIPTTEDHVKILTNHVVYGFITKVIFYLTIRRYFKDLPALDESDGLELSVRIRKAFAKARNRDWQAVFEEDPIEQLGIPKEAHSILLDFFSELRAYHFGELPEDVIGQLFEEIIQPERRHNLGQYFTREDLVDLVIATVVRDVDGKYCDPTCGSGTFLVRLYDRLRFLSGNRKTHNEKLDQIWGFDIGKFPAELSTVNLFRQNVTDYENFPRVRKTNIFDVIKGMSFDFPPPHSGSKAIKVHVELPQFDAILGNFPYIRQELIEKEVKGYKRKLTRVLAEELLHSYPKLFELTGVKLLQLTSSRQIENALGKDLLDLRLSGQADIFAYIYLHTSTLLKNEGAFAVITSNSWLDVSYGSVLKQFFLDHFRVKMIITSWAEPWFEDAAVNTVVTVLEKEASEEKRKNNSVHFVKLKKKLEDLIPYDLQFESDRRWQKLDAIVATIEEAEFKPECKEIAKGISSYEKEDMRVRIIPQRVLEDELLEKGDSAKWGKYLRAPDVYFELLERCKDKLVPLKTLADVRFGIKTGINDFFYLERIGEIKNGLVECRNDKGWLGKIEAKYLSKVIRDSSQFERILIQEKEIKDWIFMCNKSKSDLKKEGSYFALKYIEWGEKQKNEKGIAFPDVKSVSGRKHWYGITNIINDEIIYLAAPRNRFLAFHNKDRVLLDKRLYSIEPKVSGVINILNSFINVLHLEAYGRDVNNGNAKEFTVEDVENMLVPRSNVDYDISKLERRNIKSIDEEVLQKDREDLDKKVLEALGLDIKDYLPRIYDAICETVKERLELPKMRKKLQKETIKIAIDQVKQAVQDECLPDGPSRFPDQFYDHPLSEKDIERFSTSGDPLRYEHFFGKYEMIDAQNQKVFSVDSENKAHFAIILAKPDVFSLRIPKDEKVVKKAIAKYRKYLKDLEEKLTKSADQHTHDWAMAERIAKEIMDEYGLRNY